MRIEIDLAKGYRLLEPGPIVLVTTAHRGRTNVTTVPWVSPLSFHPPLLGIAIHPSRLSHDLIRRSDEFVINVPPVDLVTAVRYCGSVSGADIEDKLAAAGLTAAEPKAVSAPLIDQCIGHLECGLVAAHNLGDHTLFVGQILVAWAESDAYGDGVWKLDIPEARPLHHLGGPAYAALEKPIRAT